jgi:hypothetical protein
MAKRRKHRKNPMMEDVILISVGAVGGAAALYLYLSSIQQAAANAAISAATPATTPAAPVAPTNG